MSQIIHHIPTWVFVLLAALVAAGVAQSFPYRASLRRITVLPLVLVGLSLMGVVTAFASQPLALLAWAGGLAASVALLHGRVDTSATRFDPETRRFAMAGSWLPLVLMMGLFSIKFTVGMLLAREPALARSAVLACTASAAYGLFSGAFLGRAMALWALARQSLSTTLQSA